MTLQHLDGIDEWRERDRLAFERAYESLRAGTAEARDVVVRILTPDKGVRITVGGDLRLRSIEINERVYETYDADGLAKVVVAGVRAARHAVMQRQRALIEKRFGYGEGDSRDGDAGT